MHAICLHSHSPMDGLAKDERSCGTIKWSKFTCGVQQMAVSKESPAPYTAGAALLTVIRRYREKGLTSPFTPDVLVRAGVTDSLVPRTMQALLALDLIDDKGVPTATMQKLRTVPEKDYTAAVAEWVQSAYAEVFSFIDPRTHNAIEIRDAFRAYQPQGQQDRMVALFMALCAEGGLADESKKAESRPRLRKPRQATNSAAPTQRRTTPTPAATAGGLPPALAGLMQSIPHDTGWTKEMRDKFVTTFQAVLDFVVPIRDHDNDEEADQ